MAQLYYPGIELETEYRLRLTKTHKHTHIQNGMLKMKYRKKITLNKKNYDISIVI